MSVSTTAISWLWGNFLWDRKWKHMEWGRATSLALLWRYEQMKDTFGIGAKAILTACVQSLNVKTAKRHHKTVSTSAEIMALSPMEWLQCSNVQNAILRALVKLWTFNHDSHICMQVDCWISLAILLAAERDWHWHVVNNKWSMNQSREYQIELGWCLSVYQYRISISILAIYKTV